MANDEIGLGAFVEFEGECQGCDVFARVDDLGLCAECSVKLDRDMIRQRDWAYSATAYGVPPEKQEELRASVISEYGADLELIAPELKRPSSSKARRRRRRK